MSDVAARWGRSPCDGAEASTVNTSAPPSAFIASVQVHADPAAALADWTELVAAAPAAAYGRPDWLLPWIEAVGLPSGLAPLIVVARDAGGRATALLPLAVQRQGALAVAGFLGGRDSNFNMGLFRPGADWTRAGLHDLLRRAAAASGRRIDLFAFRNQPHDWQGAANPLLALARQPSPSFAYKSELGADPDAFLRARLSRDTRKKLRQKMKRLGALGAVEVVEARTPGEVAEVLDAFVEQRIARNLASGLPTDELPALRRFLDRTVGGGGPVSFHALRCGGRVVATLGGTRHRDRFSGMLISITAEAEVVRNSPGELLLSEVMKRCCAAGLSTFDLGIGEARYKETYCPDVEPLFDSLVPLTPRGHVCARVEGARLQLKRAVKQSRWAWPLVQRLRRARSLLSGSAG